MKKEIKMPGFTAEASVYKSSGCYYMVGGHGSNTRPVVGPAVKDPDKLLHPKMGGWPTEPWGSSSSFLECGAECRSDCKQITDVYGGSWGLCWDLCVMLNC